MSRIADALARSRVADGIPDVPPAIEPAAELSPPSAWRLERRPHHPISSPPAEPTRTIDPQLIELVQRVFRPGHEPLARVVTVAAVGGAEIPRPLGLSMARTLASYGAGTTVCVIDAAINGALSDPAGEAPAGGVAEMLTADVAPASLAVAAGPGVWHVPAGTAAWPADWANGWPHVMAALADAFDFIIVVTTVANEPDAVGPFLAIATATDGVLLTIDIAQTKPAVAGDVVTRVRASGVEVFGAITVQARQGRSA